MAQLVDLTRPLRAGMQVYPGDPEVIVGEHSTVDADGFWLHELSLGSQSGTHFDAPAHIVFGRLTSHQIPLRQLIATAHLVDATEVGAGGLIDGDLVERALRSWQAGDAVLLRTDWDRYDAMPTAWEHPGLSAEAAAALVEREVSFVGIDAASIDVHSDKDLSAHHVLAEANVPIVENLTNLAHLNWPDPLVVVAPMAWVGLDGAPVRAFAIRLE